MTLSLKNNRKQNENILTLSFLKEMSKKDDFSKRIVTLDSDSNEIAKIIADKLLKKVQKQIILK